MVFQVVAGPCSTQSPFSKCCKTGQIQRLAATVAGARNRQFLNTCQRYISLSAPPCLSFPSLSLTLCAISQVYPHGFGFHQCTYNGEATQACWGSLERVLLPCAPEHQCTSLTSTPCPREQPYEIQFLHQFFKNVFLIEINRSLKVNPFCFSS